MKRGKRLGWRSEGRNKERKEERETECLTIQGAPGVGWLYNFLAAHHR